MEIKGSRITEIEGSMSAHSSDSELNTSPYISAIQTPRWFVYTPYIFVFIGPLLLFGPALIRGEVLYWGLPTLQFVPWRTFALDALRHGQFPLWNPDLGMGAPLFANYQVALLYPPNLLLLITPIAWGQTFLVMAHLVWAGLGMALLGRRLGLGPLAQIIASMSFSLSGYFIARVGFISMNAAGAWLPWILLAVWYMVDRAEQPFWGKRGALLPTVLLAVVLSMQWYAGHAQLAWYSAIFAFAWGCWQSYRQEGVRGVRRFAPMVVLAGFFGFCLTAAQLLPTLEYLHNSYRSSGVEFEQALTYSFWPWRLTELFSPYLFGNPAEGNYWGYANFWEDSIYIGIFAMLYALNGAFAPGRDRISIRNFLLITVAIGLILALGKNTPIFPFLFRWIPTFDSFQAPSRWMILVVFSLSMLAGIGVDHWRAPAGRSLYWWRLATAGAVAFSITALLARSFLSELQPTFAPALAAMGFWIFVVGMLALIANTKGTTMYWQLGVGTFALVNLVWFGKELIPTIDHDYFEKESSFASEFGAEHRAYMPSEVEYDLTFNNFFRFDAFKPETDTLSPREVGLANTNLLDRYASANNFDPFLPESYVKWIVQTESFELEPQKERLSFMDVSRLITIPAGGNGEIEFEEISNPRRVWLVHDAIWVEDNIGAFTALEDPHFSIAETVILEGEGKNRQNGDDTGAEILQFTEYSITSVEVVVQSNDGVWVVLSDTYYPGWRAFLDDNQTELYRANGNFRAVWSPSGEHTISFQYLPVWFVVGIVVSLIGWLILLAIGFRWVF
jgi:hypothetical protein